MFDPIQYVLCLATYLHRLPFQAANKLLLSNERANVNAHDNNNTATATVTATATTCFLAEYRDVV